MTYAPLSFVQNAFRLVFHWVEEIWQDTVNLRLELIELRKRVDRLEAGLAHMEKKERRRDLAVQLAFLHETHPNIHTRRLQQFKTLAPETNAETDALQSCFKQAMEGVTSVQDKLLSVKTD
jgi:hypothetical protein